MERFDEHGKIGMTAAEIVELRREKLNMALKLLGYSSISSVRNELNDVSGYMALDRIGKQLENYTNLGAYVYVTGIENGVTTYGFNIPEEMSQEEFQAMIQTARAELDEDKAFVEEKDDQYSRMRDKNYLMPDYFLNMREKVSEEDWAKYSKVVRDTAQLYLELNSDLVPYGDRMGMGVADAHTLVGNEVKDRISRLIDTQQFSEAEHISYAVQQKDARAFANMIDTMFEEEPTLTRSGIKDSLEDLRDIALATEQEKRDIVGRYNQFMQEISNRKVKRPEDIEKRGRTHVD